MVEEQPSESRTWASERREFSVQVREESLDAREAIADVREATADDREAVADQWLLDHDLIDEAGAVERQKEREQRAHLRTEREAERAQAAAARVEEVQRLREHGVTSDYPLAALFAELATTLFVAGSVGEVLDHLVVAGAQVVPGADAVSVTVRRRGEHSTPAHHGDLALRLDQLQYEHGQGPSLDATETSGEAYAACADLAADTPWPTFAPAAVTAGGRSVLALGMFPDPSASLPRLATLNFYANHPDAFAHSARDIGMLLAAHASVALASTKALSKASLREAHLEQAMESRDVIGQAKGILMERQGLTPDQAFDKLRDASNRLNTKLGDLARHLADTGEAPPPRR